MDKPACPYPSCGRVKLRTLLSLQAATRTTASISLVSSVLVIASYTCSDRFHAPLNRLIFYATWGNLLANVAEVIAQDGPKAGVSSSLCLFQAFFIEWFTSADALWNLCISFNVYLSIFRQYSLTDLRKLNWRYFIFCYGFQFVPAFVFFFISTGDRGEVYGDAILWCWISNRWRILRLTVYFIPVWVSFLIALGIYTAAGIRVYVIERRARHLAERNNSVLNATELNGQPLTENEPTSQHASQHPDHVSSGSHSVLEFPGSSPHMQAQERATREPGVTFMHDLEASGSTGVADSPLAGKDSPPLDSNDLETPPESSTQRIGIGTVNDLENHPTAVPEAEKPLAQSFTAKRRAATAYAQFACLYFIALIFTWVPPSANRIYIFVHPERPNIRLLYASGIGISLQGFWNGIIFFTTSWDAVKESWKTLKSPRHWSMPALFIQPYASTRSFISKLRDRGFRTRISSR